MNEAKLAGVNINVEWHLRSNARRLNTLLSGSEAGSYLRRIDLCITQL